MNSFDVLVMQVEPRSPVTILMDSEMGPSNSSENGYGFGPFEERNHGFLSLFLEDSMLNSHLPL